jgi:hypothetical protein
MTRMGAQKKLKHLNQLSSFIANYNYAPKAPTPTLPPNFSTAYFV